MNIAIDQMDNKLKQALVEYSTANITGEVVSTFERVINIKLFYPSCLIAIATDNVISAPYMMKTKNLKAFNELQRRTKIGDSICFNEKKLLIINTCTVDYTPAKTWDNSINIKPLNYSVVENKYNNLKTYLSEFGKTGGILTAFLMREEGTHQIIPKMYDSYFKVILDQLETELSVDNLQQFIGLGVGLTPSGDDFITGLLSVLYCYAQHQSKITELICSLKNINFQNKTTHVSSYMISNALTGQVNTPLKDYIALELDNKRMNKQLIDSIISIGSTSGTDMLVGVCFGFKYLIKNKGRV